MKNEAPSEKRPYVKPELRRVSLEPEESFAAGCKTPSSSAPAGLTCETNSCFNFGS